MNGPTKATLWNHFQATGMPKCWADLDLTGLRAFVADYAEYIAHYVGDAEALKKENEAIALHGAAPSRNFRIPPLTVGNYFEIWMEQVRLG